jgi:uncharacterized protein YbjT (DUF2867 family)
MKTLLLVGATGLVGQSVLQQALDDPRVGKVVALTRRPLQAHPKLENPVVEFDRLAPDAPWWKADAVICTLGTTIAQAGSQAAFRTVDRDYPLAVATLAQAHGTLAFALNSAMGADPGSRVFYNRTKGELEQALAELGFPSLTLVRPGLIGGKRAKIRPAEFIGVHLLGALGPILPRRYRVVPAERIAASLLDAALCARPGRRAIESEQL